MLFSVFVLLLTYWVHFWQVLAQFTEMTSRYAQEMQAVSFHHEEPPNVTAVSVLYSGYILLYVSLLKSVYCCFGRLMRF